MKSTEEVSWKLAVCTGCGQRKMMPEMNDSCLECDRESRATTLSPEVIRWEISYREPGSFIRGAWKLASEDTSAAMGVNVRTGAVTAHRWPAGEDMPVEETEEVLILAMCPASRKAELPKLLAEGSEGLLSGEAAVELAAEVVVRSSLGDDGKRFWSAVEEQLRKMPELHESDARRGEQCT